jgi:RND family efflux transporter MFP subunit
MTNDDLSKLKIDKSEASFPVKKRGKWLPWLWAAILVALLAFLYRAGVFTPAVTVDVSTVSQLYPSQTFTLLNASGYVVAQRKASVASKITGRLVSVSVEEGSTIKRGEIIARLESLDAAALKDQAAANLDMARAGLEQARADLNAATLTFNRTRELLSRNLVARADFDTAEAAYKKSLAAVKQAEEGIRAGQAALRGAEVALEYSLIRAPFDAVVLTKNANVGDIVTPISAAANAKASVVTIADMHSLQVEVDVSESSLHSVKTGAPCEIQLDALPDSRFRGAVHMIVPTADRTKATILIKVRFIDNDKRILPEMSAKVAFLQRPVGPGEQRPRLAVDRTAVVTRNGKPVAFLVKGDRAAAISVKTGERLGDAVEILAGLHAGDRIITKPSEGLKNGAKIKIAEK